MDKKSGDLLLTAPDRSGLRQLRPNVYQKLADKRVAVAGGYRMLRPRNSRIHTRLLRPKAPGGDRSNRGLHYLLRGK